LLKSVCVSYKIDAVLSDGLHGRLRAFWMGAVIVTEVQKAKGGISQDLMREQEARSSILNLLSAGGYHPQCYLEID